MQRIKGYIEKFASMDEKSKVLAKNVSMSFLVKGAAMLVAFVNIPVFMGYFGDNSVLGVWLTLLSMLSWVLMFDLGIGNGLRNHLVIALEKGDFEESRKLIASAYCSSAVLTIALALLALVFIPQMDWNSICNIGAEVIAPASLTLAIEMLAIGLLIQFFLKTINSILYALQKSAIPNFLLLCSNSMLLVATFLVNAGDAQCNLLNIAMAYVITANAPMLIATLYVFFGPLKAIGFHPFSWSVPETKKVIGLGLSFLVLQLLSMATFNTREFYIMSFVDPGSVVNYQIYNRLFSLVSTFFVLAMTPMWSAITQAFAQGDYHWIKSLYSRFIKVLLLFSAFGLVVVFFSQFIVDIWLGNQRIEMSFFYGLLFAIFNIEYMWVSLHSQFENGLKRLRAQTWGYLASTILLPVLSVIFLAVYDDWIVVVLSSVIALLPLCFFQYINMRKILREYGMN